MVLKKSWGRALAVLLAFSAPVSGLAQDVPAHNPEGTISISASRMTNGNVSASNMNGTARKASDGALDARTGVMLGK